MNYTLSEQDSIQILAVGNILDELDDKVIIAEIQARMQSGASSLVVDLSKQQFMNSTGLNFLLKLMNTSKKSGGKLALANASQQVKDLLEITKLQQVFQLQPSVEEAVRIVRKA